MSYKWEQFEEIHSIDDPRRQLHFVRSLVATLPTETAAPELNIENQATLVVRVST